jgi:uncharacterized protein YndB with AHSA1/START domain
MAPNPPVTDRIEKQVKLEAPVARVWEAIANAEQFGRWFGVKLDGPFVEGQAVRGVWGEGDLPVDAIRDIEAQLGLEPSPVKMPDSKAVFCTVERIDRPRLFSFRWIPYGIDATIDPAHEPTTLVEFRLDAQGSATLLTIVESGFDHVPAHRRRRAFLMNDGGWTAQAENLRKHVQGS